MQDYISNPNQRYIETHKEKTDVENKYAKINLNALQNAMSTLSPKAFQLWIYLSKNKDEYKLWLSKTDFLKWSKYKSTAYYEAFNELVDLGYLIERDENNKYDFYELPKEEAKIHVTIHKE